MNNYFYIVRYLALYINLVICREMMVLLMISVFGQHVIMNCKTNANVMSFILISKSEAPKEKKRRQKKDSMRIKRQLQNLCKKN